MDDKVFQALMKERCEQDAKFYKKLLDSSPAAAPASGDVFQDALDNIKKSSATLSGWRRVITQYAGPISQVIGCKLGDMAAAGQAPDISTAQITDALRKGASIPFETSILNDFAGFSQGPGPTGAPVFKAWDEVIEQGAWRLQKATQSAKQYVRPKDIGPFPDTDYQVNAYSRESGLVFFHTVNGRTERLLYAGYPLGSDRILWLGQMLDNSLQPLSKDSFTVALNWRSQAGGQRAFYLIMFTITVDQKGNAKLANSPMLEATFIADGRPYGDLRGRILAFKDLFRDWRNRFSNAHADLGKAIAEAFREEQKDPTRQAFPVVAPLWGGELHDAFTNDHQIYDFQLSDLNQFAGNWKALIYSYQPDFPPVPQFLNWLEFTQSGEAYYQRVVGSASPVVDPLLLYGDEQGLMNVVIDAYLPECGSVSWLFGYGPDPKKAESAVMAYKLASNRTLWVAQFFDQKTVTDAMKKKAPLPPSDVFNLTLEWIVPEHRVKYRHLVSKTFTINFAAGAVAPSPNEPIVKMKSNTV